MVVNWTAPLKVAETGLAIATPVAPGAGLSVVTVVVLTVSVVNDPRVDRERLERRVLGVIARDRPHEREREAVDARQGVAGHRDDPTVRP